MNSRELELKRIIHILIKVVEQIGEFIDKRLLCYQRFAVSCLIGQYFELLWGDAGSDEFLLKSIIYIFIGARVETAGNEKHSVLGENDIVEKFLYLACCLLAVGLQIRRNALRGISQQLFYFLPLLSDGILVDFDDVKESG